MIKSQCKQQEQFKGKVTRKKKEDVFAFTMKSDVYSKLNQTVSLTKCKGCDLIGEKSSAMPFSVTVQEVIYLFFLFPHC